MDWVVGEYVKRDRNKAANIHRLPRKKQADPTNWKVNNRKTKALPQECCKHRQPYHKTGRSKVNYPFQCLNYVDHIKRVLRAHSDLIGTDDVDTFITNTFTDPYHKLSNNQRLLFVSQLLRWQRPWRNRKNSPLTTNQYDDTYPKCFELKLNGYYGFDQYRICNQFLRHLIGVGHQALQSIFLKIWISRRKRLLIPDWNVNVNNLQIRRYDDWLERWEQHILNNYALTKAHYINQPGKGTSDKVYIDTTNGQQLTYRELFWDWIRVDQPLAANYHDTKREHDIWRRTDGQSHTEPEITDYAKPTPAPWWAIHIFTRTFNIGIKRVGKDICPVHNTLESEIDHLMTLEPEPTAAINQLKNRISKHQQRADDTYDMVHHSKAHCSASVWSEKDWDIKLDENHMIHDDRCIHIEFDPDHSRPEVDIKEQDAHYESKETINAVSIVHKPLGRLNFMWSEMDGGKGSDAIITVLLHVMNRMSFGASHVVLSSDGAGSQVNRYLVMFLHWICSHFNPDRLFKSVVWILYVNGHNYNESDNIGHQLDNLMEKVYSFFTVEDRVEYLKKKVPPDLMIFLLQALKSIPAEFEDIYLKYEKWKDQFGMKLRVKLDKPCCYQFGHVTLWDKTLQKYIVKEDQDAIYVRQSLDWKVPPRRIEIMDRKTTMNADFDWNSVHWTQHIPPPVKAKKLKGTKKLIRKFAGKRIPELMDYYECSNVIGTEEEKKDNNKGDDGHKYYSAMIDTNDVYEQILRTGKKQSLPLYPGQKRKRKRGRAEAPGQSNIDNNRQRVCDKEKKYGSDQLLESKGRAGLSMSELIEEQEVHGVHVNGRKKEDIALGILNHYNTAHSIERVSEDV